MDERSLIEAACQDPKAFAALYDRYVDRIYGYAYRLTQDEEQAKDITSATFEKALRHLRSYRHKRVDGFRAWLYTIAHNEIARHYRRKAIFRRLLPRLEAQARMHQSQPDDTTPAHELHEALRRLAERDREIIVLRFLEGFTSAEVADILGCSVNNVYVRLHRALNRLREVLGELEQTNEHAGEDNDGTR